MKKFFVLSLTALLFAACASNDVDSVDDSKLVYIGEKEASDYFDFSTSNDVMLTVDYSANSPIAPVFFRVYSENPFNGDELDPNIKPVYSNYTDGQGRFSQSVELPSYATNLYIFTGDFFVDEQLMNVQVANKVASAIAGSTRGVQRAAANRRASQGSGVLTNSLETLYQLSYEVDYKTGDKLDNQIYNDWKTWLGQWDSRTGRPDYLIKENNENYAALTFNAEDMKGIRQSIAAAIVRKETCPVEFRQSADLTLKEPAAVSVTLVGSNTCWNNSIGYYYYTGDAPTDLKNIHVVMLFPNTQDGQSQFIGNRESNYNGNIALNRGDAVQLIYYPNIASGSQEGATTTFPANTKIGFLLKSNGWGMQKPHDGIKYHNSYTGAVSNAPVARQYNCWSSSTDGLSYCEPNAEQNQYDPGSVGRPNSERKSRTAKFAYEKDGQQYAIVAFEDAANDEDYGDVILALKPVGVFQDLPVPTTRITTTKGVYAYEDLWPSAGDYDMNDAVVEVKEDRELTLFTFKNSACMTKQTFNLTTYQNYVELQSGLALTLETSENPTSIVMKKVLPETTDTVPATFRKDGNVYLLTDNFKGEIHTTYILELTYAEGIQDSKAAKIKPFIYRDEENNKRWEVHIPFEAPTSKMNTAYFGTQDDRSDPAKKLYFVREGNYPFAFYLSGVGIEAFQDNILLRPNEQKAIDVFFPKFIEWSTSKGAKNKDWYKHPATTE
jgi:LruC domain-containing protein